MPDAVLLFVSTLAEVENLTPDAIAAAGHDGLLWLAYPKGSSGVATDLNRDNLWRALTPMGLRPVRQIALDEVWSALRFRPGEWRPVSLTGRKERSDHDSRPVA